jgi:hypothetical protein
MCHWCTIIKICNNNRIYLNQQKIIINLKIYFFFLPITRTFNVNVNNKYLAINGTTADVGGKIFVTRS